MEKKRAPILAVDFDGTLCESAYPDIGKPYQETIDEVIQYKKDGWKLILWTCRCGKRLEEAVRWCEEHGLFLTRSMKIFRNLSNGLEAPTAERFTQIYI